MMMNSFKRLLFFGRQNIIALLFLVFLSTRSLAQDVNYWISQVGNTSSLLAGAAISGTFDNSGIYYNPGSLPFVENTGISLSGNAFYFKVFNIINGAGDGIPLKASGLTGAPSLISGVIKNKKNPDLSITYAVINMDLVSTLFTVQNNMYYDVIKSIPGNEYYVGTYKYSNHFREDWFGVGWGQKFFNSRFGIGISQFVSFRSQDFLKNSSAQVFETNEPYSVPISTHTIYNDFTFRNISLIWKIGVNLELEKFKLGFVVTTPKANLPILNGRLLRNEYVDIPSVGDHSYKATFVEKTPTIHKIPWIFDLGGSVIKDKYSVYGRLMIATRVKKYNMFRYSRGKQEFINLPPEEDVPFKSMWTALRPVVNVALGYGRNINKNFALLGGVSSDMNAYDQKNLPREDNYVPNIGYLNLYHLSAGTLWYEKKYRLTVGFSYTLGFSKGDLQQVNLSSPSDETLLFGINDHSTRTRFNQIGFHFGFTYLFSRL